MESLDLALKVLLEKIKKLNVIEKRELCKVLPTILGLKNKGKL